MKAKKNISLGVSDGSISSEVDTLIQQISRANRIAQRGYLSGEDENTNKALLIDKSLNSKLFSTGFFKLDLTKKHQ